MNEKKQKSRIIALMIVFVMVLIPILSMIVINSKAETGDVLLTGVIYYPQCYNANVHLKDYDFSLQDVGAGWDTHDVKWEGGYNFYNNGASLNSSEIVDQTFGTYFEYYAPVNDFYYDIPNLTLRDAYAVAFGSPRQNSQQLTLAEGAFTMFPHGIPTNISEETTWPYNWWTTPTHYNWNSGDYMFSDPDLYTPWNNSWKLGEHNWIGVINSTNDPAMSNHGIIPVSSYADYIANGGTAFSTNTGAPWIIQPATPVYETPLPSTTGLRAIWNITKYINITDLVSSDFQLYYVMPQDSSARYVDYVGIFYRFTEDVVSDYYITIEFGDNTIIMGFIWLIMIFLPAMLLAQVAPKYGFIGGVALMLIVLEISQSGFTATFLIGITAIGVLLIKGD